jgi:2'-5' RNA ligase
VTIDETTLTGAPWTVEPGAIVFVPDPTEGWTVDEAYAFLARENPNVVTGETESEFLETLTAAADVHEGAMIAFIPSEVDLERLALENGEDAEQLHITAFYLGTTADIDDEEQAAIIDAIADWFTGRPIIRADVFGFGTFNPDGEEPCLIANVGGGELEDARDDVSAILDEIEFAYPEQHDPWIPHITLIYADDPYKLLTDELNPLLGPIVIDRVRVAFGGVATDIPLGDLAASAAFHLAGQHDQHSHGKGGASAGELAAGERLNRGKKLDQNDPEQARIHGTINTWSEGGNEGARVTYEMQEAVHNPGADTDGAQLMRVVGGAPANSPELHRGMNGVIHGEDLPTEVDVFSLGPTSFTRSKKIADDFATPPYSDIGGATVVHMRLAKGSHSLRVDQEITGKFKNEQEHITLGRFKVTGRTERTATVKAKDGRPKDVRIIDLNIAQVDESVPITHHKGGKAPIIGPGMDI